LVTASVKATVSITAVGDVQTLDAGTR
jgi:hypothetical protein